MALKNVVIGYAKGDKGDKGDTGERGATGQTGPQGEPGNIADAAITDTQGLDVAKGAKTTAQKLFDAIADRIVNKLVTNDTLTTKLADYLLKSAMSSTNINSTTNVPTSALVYSLLQDVNNNLSNVKKGITVASWGTILQCQKDDLIRRLQLAASTDDVYLAKSTDGGTNFTILGSLALKSDLEKQASFEPYVLNTNVSEYIKSLSAGKVHFFKTSSGTSGNPYTGGSCFYMVYIIDTSHNGIGLALNHSTTAYFMRISLGDVVYTKLSA